MYNSGLRYNSGAVYNSLPISILVADSAFGAVTIDQAINLAINIQGIGLIAINTDASFNVIDSGQGAIGLLPEIALLQTVSGIGETTLTQDAEIIILIAGVGIDMAQTAKMAFLIDSNNVLQPLDVYVLKDSRYELLPTTRDYFEVIPGRHGEIDFGSEFEARTIELQVANRQEFSFEQREEIRSALAAFLSPLYGPQALVFADDPDKTYLVRTAGSIDLVRRAKRFMFSIPLRCSSPFIFGTWEKHHTGSGKLVNAGTIETPVTIEIVGPVTNPSINVEGQTLTYTGSLIAGDKLLIDTEALTVMLNGINAIANFTGTFPKLQPGDNVVVAASTGTTQWRWRDRWV